MGYDGSDQESSESFWLGARPKWSRFEFSGRTAIRKLQLGSAYRLEMDVTGLNDRALVERYHLLRADLDRTRDTDKRLALHRELQNIAAERQRRHSLAVAPLRS